VPVGLGGYAQGAAAGHGVFGVEEQVEKDLLQLAGIAVDAGRCSSARSGSTWIRGLELVLEQLQSVSRMTWFRSISVNSVPLVREKLSRPLTISERGRSAG
jgi:hypothetical protein